MPFSITKTRANVGTKFAESVRLSRSSVQRRSLANHRSSSSSSPATSSSQILQRNENLAPIQLQEFARKQFEKKTLEKSRKIEQKIKRFKENSLKNQRPEQIERTPAFTKWSAPHFFNSDVTHEIERGFIERAFDKLERC